MDLFTMLVVPGMAIAFVAWIALMAGWNPQIKIDHRRVRQSLRMSQSKDEQRMAKYVDLTPVDVGTLLKDYYKAKSEQRRVEQNEWSRQYFALLPPDQQPSPAPHRAVCHDVTHDQHIVWTYDGTEVFRHCRTCARREIEASLKPRWEVVVNGEPWYR